MKGQIALSIFLVNLLFVFTTSETPEDRCTEEGQSVCVNCQQVGTCMGSAPPYTVENITECDYLEDRFCDVKLEPGCYRLNPATSECGCSEKSCIVDPNTENVYIPCNGEEMGKAFYCPPAKIEMVTCVCSSTGRPTLSTLESSTSDSSTTSELSTTPEVSSTSEISTTTELSSTSEIPTTTTGLSSTSEVSTTTELSSTSELPTTTTGLSSTSEIPTTTTGLSSTSEVSTTTELSSTSEIPTTTGLSSTSEISTTTELSSTSEIPTTTTLLSSTSEIPTTTTVLSSTSEISTTTELSTTTTTKLTCPDDCPFVQDPNEVDCRKYFQCTDEGNVPSQCPSSLCFSQEQCACAPPLECTDDCEFVDDPFDDCKKYYYCYNDQLIEYSCTGSSCFSQSSCGCVEEKSSTMSTSTSISTSTSTTPTTPTTTKPTCPPGCPFVDDPNDDCKKFFICENGGLVPHECPGSLCYREATCQCDV